MNWQEQLRQLEHKKQWDTAIDFMEGVVANNPDCMEAYLSIEFLLMNLLCFEKYDFSKSDYYCSLLKKYFSLSYAKFSDNAAYLYYMGKTLIMSEFYLDLETEDVIVMLEKASALEPNNPLYNWEYYHSLNLSNPDERHIVLTYIDLIFTEGSPLRTELQSRGMMGEYILGLLEIWGKMTSAQAHCLMADNLPARHASYAMRAFLTACSSLTPHNAVAELFNYVDQTDSPMRFTWSTIVIATTPTVDAPICLTKAAGLKAIREFLKTYRTTTNSTDFDTLIDDLQLSPDETTTKDPVLWQLWCKCFDEAHAKDIGLYGEMRGQTK